MREGKALEVVAGLLCGGWFGAAAAAVLGGVLWVCLLVAAACSGLGALIAMDEGK